MDWSSCLTDKGIATLDCIPLLIQNLVYWAIRFAGVVALFLLIFAGIKFISSGGDPKSVDSAKKTATYALIGLILVFLSFFIIQLIGQITGLTPGCINNFGFTNCT